MSCSRRAAVGLGGTRAFVAHTSRSPASTHSHHRSELAELWLENGGPMRRPPAMETECARHFVRLAAVWFCAASSAIPPAPRRTPVHSRLSAVLVRWVWIQGHDSSTSTMAAPSCWAGRLAFRPNRTSNIPSVRTTRHGPAVLVEAPLFAVINALCLPACQRRISYLRRALPRQLGKRRACSLPCPYQLGSDPSILASLTSPNPSSALYHRSIRLPCRRTPIRGRFIQPYTLRTTTFHL